MIKFFVSVGLIFAVGLATFLWAEPNLINLQNILSAPNFNNLLGTDELGRDVLSRLSGAVFLSFSVGLAVLFITATIGVLVGVISGWYGGWVDTFLMRITDVFLAFPGILIAILFAALTGAGVLNVIMALGLMGWVTFARLARAQTLVVKGQAYVQSAILAGVSLPCVFCRYVLPNITAPLVVECIFTVSGAIIGEAGLSFLGIGVQPPTASLGTMLREGTRYMLVAPHLVFVPALTLMAMVLMLNRIGEKLRKR